MYQVIIIIIIHSNSFTYTEQDAILHSIQILLRKFTIICNENDFIFVFRSELSSVYTSQQHTAEHSTANGHSTVRQVSFQLVSSVQF